MNEEIAFERLIIEFWPCQKHQNGADSKSYESLKISETLNSSDFVTRRIKIKRTIKAAIFRVLDRYNLSESVVDFYLGILKRLNSARTTARIAQIIADSRNYFIDSQLS